MSKPGTISSFELIELAMPMKTPFVHARAARTLAENLLVRLVLDGKEGIGEGVPRDYVTGESLASAYDAIGELDLGAIERDLDLTSFATAVLSIEALDLPRRLQQGANLGLAAACTVELALLDAVGKIFDKPLRAIGEVIPIPVALRQTEKWYPISYALDMSATPAEQRKKWRTLPSHFKVKIGTTPEEDLARVRAVREAFGDGISLATDVNMAWTLEQAIAIQPSMAACAIAWHEEPFQQRRWADCRAFREATGAKIMLDESLCSYADGETAIGERACDYFNIRLSKCGGLIAALRLVLLGHQHGIGFQVGAQIGEMAVLCAAARHLHGIVRGAVGYEGSNVTARFDVQIADPPLWVDREHARVAEQPGPGLGVVIAPAGLKAAHRRSVILRRDTLSASL